MLFAAFAAAIFAAMLAATPFRRHRRHCHAGFRHFAFFHYYSLLPFSPAAMAKIFAAITLPLRFTLSPLRYC